MFIFTATSSDPLSWVYLLNFMKHCIKQVSVFRWCEIPTDVQLVKDQFMSGDNLFLFYETVY